MRYLGLIAAVVVILCVFAYITRLPTNNATSSQDYGATVNAVRDTVRNASGAERRRSWVISLQMRSNLASFGTEGENAETLVVRSDSMDFTFCSAFAEGENGAVATSVGFASLSCRTTENGIISEIPLP